MNPNRKKKTSDPIDERTQEDLEREFCALAASYVPEWRFDRENPDIGSVLALLFAQQMSGNIERYNQVMQKYRIEFVNMLGLSLHPASPARATVLMDLVQDTIPGTQVKKGTKLLAQTEEDEQLIFETLHDLYVTNASLNAAFMTVKEKEKIIPLKGEFDAPQLFEPLTEELTPPEAADETLHPFGLFDGRMEGIEQNALIIDYPASLDVLGEDLFVRLKDNEALLMRIKNGQFGFWYPTAEGLKQTEETEVLFDGQIRLKKEKEEQSVERDGVECNRLVLKTDEPVKKAMELTDVRICSVGGKSPAEFVTGADGDLNGEQFLPFGDRLALYAECYIGHDNYFSKAGATVNLTFHLSFEEFRLLAPEREEEKNLKVIKRQPKAVYTDVPADAYAEEIALEYFNGLGWKKLECTADTRYLFSKGEKADIFISFICPDDWEKTTSGAYHARCIRLRLIKSDNCYLNPCIHHYPVLSDLNLSFSYEGEDKQAYRLSGVSGTTMTDLTAKLREGNGFTAFCPIQYEEDGIYLGFTRKLTQGPVSLWFCLDENARFHGVACRFFYSSRRGFLQMKVVDHTMGMTKSGIVRFLPPTDMDTLTLEGKTMYWIRISPAKGEKLPEPGNLPRVSEISFNAVETQNTETLDEEDFYLTEVMPNMEVPLGVSHILDVDLWVNERGLLSLPTMQQMLTESPDDVRIEYDMLGQITSFYVHWEETNRLDFVDNRRSYVLDRLNSKLIFGDGILSDFPRELNRVAFKAVIRRCDGERGNVAAGAISESMDTILFVNRIINPVKAYGGSDMESLNGALRRGANIIKSRKRLVTMDDYVEQIQSFSDRIAQVAVVTGINAEGEKEEQAVTFIILMRDYAIGSYSFHSLADSLKKHLNEECELTIPKNHLYLTEPVYAKISVDLWVRIQDLDESFEVQNLFTDTLVNYLDPVEGEFGSGWQIGVLPKRVQLLMHLNMLRKRGIVQKMAVAVSWDDGAGHHETDLDSAPENLFFICCSGTHHINTVIDTE